MSKVATRRKLTPAKRKPLAKSCVSCSYLRDHAGYSGVFSMYLIIPATIHRVFSCVRFPRAVPTAPAAYCGEYARATKPLGDDTEATRKIAAWAAEHGTYDEIMTNWKERERIRREQETAEREARYARLNAFEPIKPPAPKSGSPFDWLFGA